MREYLYQKNWAKFNEALEYNGLGLEAYATLITDELVSEFSGDLVFIYDDWREQMKYLGVQLNEALIPVEAIAQMVANMTNTFHRHMMCLGYSRIDLHSVTMSFEDQVAP